jgi:hypothetical protein
VHLSEKVFEEPLNVYFNKDTVMEDHETGRSIKADIS